jgi:alpha-tubulin suppressor-like RCC1 family protein
MRIALPFPLPTARILGRCVLAAAFWFVSCKDGTDPEPAVSIGRRLLIGDQAACALGAGGVVYCWGTNTQFWEYGGPPTTFPTSATPFIVPVPSLIALGSGHGTHFCGIKASKEGVCWGRGTFGQLGAGSTGATGNAASTVGGGFKWDDIAVGRISTCGLAETGNAYCWGTNQQGEAGAVAAPIGGTLVTPVKVDSSFAWRQVSAGWLHACGISNTGVAYCWGGNTSGAVGLGVADSVVHQSPERVTGTLSFLQLALGSRYTCGISTDSTAFCWGSNGSGQLGDGTLTDRPFPVPVAGGLKFKQIATSSGFGSASTATPPTSLQGGVGSTCALTGAGKAYCWGWNGDGQVGDGTFTDRTQPVAVSSTEAFDEIAVGSNSACGRRANAIWCWGSNSRSQLGNPTITGKTALPVQVAAPFDKP